MLFKTFTPLHYALLVAYVINSKDEIIQLDGIQVTDTWSISPSQQSSSEFNLLYQ